MCNLNTAWIRENEGMAGKVDPLLNESKNLYVMVHAELQVMLLDTDDVAYRHNNWTHIEEVHKRVGG